MTVRRMDWKDEAEQKALMDLRARVLRTGRPPETARIIGDDDARTVHVGAFGDDGRLLGVASLFEIEGDNRALQLRAMAVEPDVRGTGVGARVVRWCEDFARARERNLWCQARVVALGFYARLGWVSEGDEFDVPLVGPHYVMRKTLTENVAR